MRRVVLIWLGLGVIALGCGGSGGAPVGAGGASGASGSGGADAAGAGGGGQGGMAGAAGSGATGGAAGLGAAGRGGSSGVAGAAGATAGAAGSGTAGRGGTSGAGGAAAGTSGGAGSTGVAGRGGASGAGAAAGAGGRGGSAGAAAGTGGRGGAGGGTGGAVPLLPRTSGRATFAIPGRTETAIDLVVPAGLGASPPLVIAFHPTGGEPSEAISDFELEQNAARYKFVAVAPRAGYRNGVHPADVDHELNGGDSSWNMWAQGLATNEDLRYVLALIDSAHATFNVDTTRVYTVGFSNGAFFAYFAAASLPDRIAGFAENSGGWTTRSCPTAYGSTSYQQSSSSVPSGTAIACSTLFSDASFPINCQVSASNPLTAPPLGARIPFGYLAHYSSDDTVSVQWSCFLSQALGSRAQITVRFQDTDGTRGHNMQPDAFDRAWTFFAGRSTAD